MCDVTLEQLAQHKDSIVESETKIWSRDGIIFFDKISVLQYNKFWIGELYCYQLKFEKYHLTLNFIGKSVSKLTFLSVATCMKHQLWIN